MKRCDRVVLFAAVFIFFSYQTSAESSQLLAGSWRLVSSEGHGADGRIVYDQGKEPTGRVMFDARGRMSIHLTDPNRRKFESGDFLRPTPEELIEAFRGYFGYFGSYTMNEEAGTVTFHVEGAAYPNYVGTDQVRFYTIDGDRLTLRTPPERAGGTDVTYYVTWERED